MLWLCWHLHQLSLSPRLHTALWKLWHKINSQIIFPSEEEAVRWNTTSFIEWRNWCPKCSHTRRSSWFKVVKSSNVHTCIFCLSWHWWQIFLTISSWDPGNWICELILDKNWGWRVQEGVARTWRVRARKCLWNHSLKDFLHLCAEDVD